MIFFVKKAYMRDLPSGVISGLARLKFLISAIINGLNRFLLEMSTLHGCLVHIHLKAVS